MTRAGKTIPVSPDQLLDLWRHEEIRVICQRPQELEDQPDLPLRVRGALGPVIAEMGPPVSHRFDPFDRPPPFATLFSSSGHEVRPFVVRTDIDGDRVIVDLRLFGRARIWSDQVRDGLCSALSNGIALRGGGRMRVPFSPIDCFMRRVAAPEKPKRFSDIACRFKTPVRVRGGDYLKASPSSILKSMVTRVREMASWDGLSVQAEWPALHRLADGLDCSGSDFHPSGLRRFTRRDPGKAIASDGLLGVLKARGAMEELMPFVLLAEFTHVGGNAALGFGRFELASY